jgi:putative methyltransferase (TIGR04325 family)
MTPLHDKVSTITLQSIGTSYCPYNIREEKNFIKNLESIGYKLVDTWVNEEKSCNIAFEKERSLDYYKGMCFKLK